MSNLSLFLRKNKKQKKNTFIAATKSLCDEEGKPLQWEVKAVSTRENNEIMEECMSFENGGKLNMNLYISKLAAKSVVFPNLNSAELQDSYGVMTPHELIQEMIDDPGEYNEFVASIRDYNGFNESMDDKVAEAKN